MKEKYAAPALERGILVLEILARDGAMTLEQLVNVTGFPKASLVRFTETLMRMGYLVRDKENKTFRTLIKLAPIEDSMAFFNQKRGLLMRRLADEVSSTVEWYLPKDHALTIIARSEPKDLPVFVRATIGFRRELDSELEAVSRIAFASGLANYQDLELWKWVAGKITPVSCDDVVSQVKATASKKMTRDVEYNINGVRRYAAVVSNQTGRLEGIIALAESFTPIADNHADEKLLLLRKTADELEKLLKFNTVV